MGWDYLRNYAWRDTMSFRDGVGIVGDLNELVGSLGELSRMRTDSERAQWVTRNYGFVLRKFKSVFNRALAVFTKSVIFNFLLLCFCIQFVLISQCLIVEKYTKFGGSL